MSAGAWRSEKSSRSVGCDASSVLCACLLASASGCQELKLWEGAHYSERHGTPGGFDADDPRMPISALPVAERAGRQRTDARALFTWLPSPSEGCPSEAMAQQPGPPFRNGTRSSQSVSSRQWLTTAANIGNPSPAIHFAWSLWPVAAHPPATQRRARDYSSPAAKQQWQVTTCESLVSTSSSRHFRPTDMWRAKTPASALS